MTGRDLIVYILNNQLEDRPVFEDDKFIGFMTIEEAAIKMDVGVATIRAFVKQGMIPSISIGGFIYIPADFKIEAKGMIENEG